MSANSPEVRISDGDRSQAMDALSEHLSTGRLDVDEFADRSANAGAARTLGELAPLFADLPQPRPDILAEARPARADGTKPWLRSGVLPIAAVVGILLLVTVGRAMWPLLIALLLAVVVLTVIRPSKR